jgi:hypothetical protein
MSSQGSTILSRYSVMTSTLLANAGFDLYCHPHAKQNVYSTSYVHNESKQLTPLQYVIENYALSLLFEDALNEMVDKADEKTLHHGRLSAIEYAVEVNPRETEMITSIMKESLKQDTDKALKMAEEEVHFRKDSLSYYTFWAFEMINPGLPTAKPISWLSQDKLDDLIDILEFKKSE